jgi:hypothetical protein
MDSGTMGQPSIYLVYFITNTSSDKMKPIPVILAGPSSMKILLLIVETSGERIKDNTQAYIMKKRSLHM